VLELTDRGRAYVDVADRLWAEVEGELADLVGADRAADVRETLRAYVGHVGGDSPVPLRPVW
jgi:hypothetical protein